MISLAVLLSLADLPPAVRLGMAASRIESSLEFAAAEARRTGRTHWFTYDLEHDRYWVVGPRTDDEREAFGEGGFALGGREDDRHRRVRIRELPGGVRLVRVGPSADDLRSGGELKFEIAPTGAVPDHVLHMRLVDDGGPLDLAVRMRPGETRR